MRRPIKCNPKICDVLKSAKLPTRLSPKTWILLTVPHGTGCNTSSSCQTCDCASYPLDDPCSDTCALRVSDMLRSSRCEHELLIACRTRRKGDQNRLNGLFGVDDLLPRLINLATEHERDFSRCLHLDVHTYTENKAPSDWHQTGFNLIHLKGDTNQKQFANRMKQSLAALSSLTPHIVEMGALPERANDPNGNAMIEWSKCNGALSLLIEIPTRDHNGTFQTSIDEETIGRAIASALASELEGHRWDNSDDGES